MEKSGDINQSKLVGGKRKNGHKMDCGCHICKNMEAKAQRNGYEEDLEKEKERKMGYQKKNGHKKDCSCPICMNMNNKNLSKKSASNKKGKKTNGHKPGCGCPICKNMKKKIGGGDEETNKNEETGKQAKVNDDSQEPAGKETLATPEDYKNLKKGGYRKTRKSNGHKPNCGCPICKNMKKKRNTKRRH